MAPPEVVVDSQEATLLELRRIRELLEQDHVAVPLRDRLAWSIAEAATMMGVSERTLHRLIADPASGFPAPKKINGRAVLMPDEIRSWLARQSTGAKRRKAQR